MIFIKNTIYISLFIFLLACNSEESKKNESKSNTVDNSDNSKKEQITTHKEEISFKFEKENYTFNVTANNKEVSELNIYTEKLEVPFAQKIQLEANVLEVLELDLDKNGFKEYYIVSKINDDSENYEILGYASLNDKSMAEIYIEDVSTIRHPKTDKVWAENGTLFRKFKDENDQILKFKYELIAGEAGFQLNPVKL